MAQGGLRNFTENPNQLNRKFPNHEAKVDPLYRFFFFLFFQCLVSVWLLRKFSFFLRISEKEKKDI